MFSLILLGLNLTLFLYILVYGLCFLMLPFVLPDRSKKKVKIDPEAEDQTETITVLIPCHHEGPSMVSTVESMIDQDYQGVVETVILINDKTDSSFAPLQKKFEFPEKGKKNSYTVYKSENRKVTLLCTGVGPKREKLNLYLPKIKSKFIGFLDADHRANPDWLSKSVSQLSDSEFVGIQGKRSPLSLKKLPQLWDSAQNHIGNELVNSALDKVVGSVFFTGTTAVFRAEALEGMDFGDCVTEDTYLSYQLLADEKKITYCPTTGSSEEVAPDLHSYIARRRRWSCGHNKTFFDNIKNVLKANVGWRAKAATLIHGLFYTVPVAVCILLNVYSLHMFLQYTWQIQALIALIVFPLALTITLMTFGKHKSVIREMFILALWFFPQTTLLFPYFLYLLDHELYFFLISFPYARYLFWSHTFCLLAPISLLVLGSLRVRLLQVHQLIVVGLSYPLFFFLDLWACLLGFSDFLFGRPTWAKIQRTHEEDALDTDNRVSSIAVMSRWGVAVGAIAFLVISFNDLTAKSNCGQPQAMFFEPTLFVPKSDIKWSVKKSAKIVDDEYLQVTFNSSFSEELPGDVALIHEINDKQVPTSSITGEESQLVSYKVPLGWRSHDYQAVLKTGDEFCSRNIAFSSTHKELKGKKLFVNGEEFLVKGVIPSFSTSRMDLTLEQGLAQIKELGANTLRYYHQTRDEVRQEVKRQQLLVVDQPHRSTWDDVNLGLSATRTGLIRRFGELQREFEGFPYTLFHTLGNELEIRNPQADLPNLLKVIKRVLSEDPSSMFSYSTYFVFLKLPSAIYGVNMLDSGQTYWKNGLETINALDKPFYASEFGGFVAHKEWTPPELRAYRIFDYYNQIVDAGGFGVIFHQSHDNLSQPVIDGFNDPLTVDRPDDVRGIWTIENHYKIVKKFIELLYTDFEYEVLDEVITKEQQTAKVWVKNRRPYHLEKVRFYVGNEQITDLFNFTPGEEKEITITIYKHQKGFLPVRAKYYTHKGLSARSQLPIILPLVQEEPTVLNLDTLDLQVSKTSISGRILRDSQLEVVFPSDWSEAEHSGATYKASGQRLKFPLRSALENVVDIQMSADGDNWEDIDWSKIGTGPNRVRFKLYRDYPEEAKLLLSGLGAKKFFIKYGKNEWQEIEAHKYRENIVELDTLEIAGNDYIYLLLPRFETIFISKEDHPLGKQVNIDLELPKVFSPPEFLIEKVS